MIAANLQAVRSTLSDGVKLIAVSKTHPNEAIMEAYQAGHRVFGENKVQEMTDKYNDLPKDIEWHLIGHLQTNKVKYIAPFVSLIHAVDSLKLLMEINKQAAKNNRVIDCLLQLHVAQEETKFGMDGEEVIQLLNSHEYKDMQHIRIVGVMAMATNTSNEDQIRIEFRSVKQIFHDLKRDFFATSDHFREISTGMSSDYLIAKEEGSTMIRVGSSIFGSRG